MTAVVTSTPADLAARFPRAATLVHEIRALSTPLLARQVEQNIARHGEAFWAEAERLLTLTEHLPGAPLAALLDYTVAYLKAQAAFLETDEYSHADFDAVRREVYDNPEVMERFYLLGLLLTHAFWPIHFDIHAFFRREFLPRVARRAAAGRGAEIGYGHGLYLLEILTAHPQATTVSFDISRYSQDFAGRLLRAGGIDPCRFDLRLGDVRERLPLGDEQCEWMVCAEVLEHIPDPALALREMSRCLAPGGPLFVTTVVDSNALDHLYRFRDAEDIYALTAECGFTLVARRTFAVHDYDARTRDPSVDVALVCTRAR
jgi:SAM-dependent methyltransferase